MPTVGLLGSGGGFRAMVCLSGVFKALSDNGILDCITFSGGLSGSAWLVCRHVVAFLFAFHCEKAGTIIYSFFVA